MPSSGVHLRQHSGAGRGAAPSHTGIGSLGKAANVVESRVVDAQTSGDHQGTETQMPTAFDATFGAAGPKTHPGRAQADAVKLGFIAITSSWLPVRLGKNGM